jgi:flagellar hook-associated protein FlgK
MWMTLDLLVAKECRKSPRDLLDELEEWLETIKTSAKIDISERSDGKTISTKGISTLSGTPDLPKEKTKKTRQNLKSTCHHGLLR